MAKLFSLLIATSLFLTSCIDENPSLVNKSESTVVIAQIDSVEEPDTLTKLPCTIDSIICDSYSCRPANIEDMSPTPLLNEYRRLLSSLDTLQVRMQRVKDDKESMIKLYESILAKRDSIRQLRLIIEADMKTIKDAQN